MAKITGFDWDDGNRDKSLLKHEVTCGEAEQVFFNVPLIIAEDIAHSQEEPRFHALGKTHRGRRLHITFTLRAAGQKIRIISARPMSRKERKIYDQT